MPDIFIMAAFDMIEEGHYVRAGQKQLEFSGKDIGIHMCRRPLYGNRRFFLFRNTVPDEFFSCVEIDCPYIEQ